MESHVGDKSSRRLTLEDIVRRYHAVIFGYVYRLTGSVPDAEDLTQQTFLLAQEKLDQLRDVACAEAWLLKIARTLFLKSRRERLVSTEPEALDEYPAEPVNTLPEDVDEEKLQAALNKLPEFHRLILTMYYYEQLSYKEIARELDLPIGTVMSRLCRAKRTLKRLLSNGRLGSE